MAETRSPEQKSADDALLEAIEARMRLQGHDPGGPTAEELAQSAGEIVTEYFVVAHVTSMDLAERDSSRYAYMTLNSGCGPDAAPHHHLEGLLRRSLRWLNEDD